MTQKPKPPQQGLADALTELTDQTRVLVREELDSARQETMRKAQQALPAIVLVAASGALAAASAASGYRLWLRLLERRMSPSAAAFTAFATSGATAVACAVAGLRRAGSAPAPVPSRTATDTARTLTSALRDAHA